MTGDTATDRSAELSPAVLHVDMDAFFAAVELLDRPELVGKPVIVGGTGQRGVVASCTYEARAFGVHSAMPSVRARQLCPDAVFLDGRHGRYSELSRQIHAIFKTVTPAIEPLGLDEAFLDVTGAKRLLGTPRHIAESLRARVADELSLDCSVGIGRSKLVAKLASRAAKPVPLRSGVEPGPGVVVVLPEEETGFLHPLPVRALWGVGPATGRRLQALGIRTVGELAQLPEGVLVHQFGRALGVQLGELARAVDPRPVVADRPAKSIGHEETFAHDVYEFSALRHHVLRMADAVAEALRGEDLAGRTVTIKVRFGDFETITRAHSVPFAVDAPLAIDAVAGALLETVDLRTGVRLLGVSVSNLGRKGTPRQLSFDVAAADAAAAAAVRAVELQSSSEELAGVVTAIRVRFGRQSMGVASMLTERGLDVAAQHQAQWGPEARAEAPDQPPRGGGARRR
jgi:DNA polymerase IV